MLITVTLSPAHFLAPTSHSLVVTATSLLPYLAHNGAESERHSDTSWQTHSFVESSHLFPGPQLLQDVSGHVHSSSFSIVTPRPKHCSAPSWQTPRTRLNRPTSAHSCRDGKHWTGILHTQPLFPTVCHSLHLNPVGGGAAVGTALQCAFSGEGDHCRLGLHMLSDTSMSNMCPWGQDKDTLSPI